MSPFSSLLPHSQSKGAALTVSSVPLFVLFYSPDHHHHLSSLYPSVEAPSLHPWQSNQMIENSL